MVMPLGRTSSPCQRAPWMRRLMVMPRAMGRPWDNTFPLNFMVQHPRGHAWDTGKLPRNKLDGQGQCGPYLECGAFPPLYFMPALKLLRAEPHDGKRLRW